LPKILLTRNKGYTIDDAMKKAVMVAMLLSIFLFPSLAMAQAPTPLNVSTLGPISYLYTDENNIYYNIQFISPQNQNTYFNQIQLNFSLSALGAFGDFANVGYCLDGGTIYSVNNFINKTVDHPADAPDWYWNRTTVFASAVLPQLSKGAHNVTVYYGCQYFGIPKNPSLQRFEVYTLKTVSFTVSSSNSLPTDSHTTPSASSFPTPTIPEFTAVLLIAFLVTITLAFTLVLRRKNYQVISG
jgi:hypothetical protein